MPNALKEFMSTVLEDTLNVAHYYNQVVFGRFLEILRQ